MKRALLAAAALGSVGVAAVVAGSIRKSDVTDGRAAAARSATVRRDPASLYLMWRSVEQLPHFLRGLVAAESAGDVRQRWTLGRSQRHVHVDVEIVRDEPGRFLEWRTIWDRPYSAGITIAFTPLELRQATEVGMSFVATGPGARAFAALARPFGLSPVQLAAESLRCFKALAETGEIPQAGRA